MMIDETTDVITTEQVVLVFRWAHSLLQAQEEFVGLYKTDSVTSDALVSIIKDMLLYLHLKVKD